MENVRVVHVKPWCEQGVRAHLHKGDEADTIAWLHHNGERFHVTDGIGPGFPTLRTRSDRVGCNRLPVRPHAPAVDPGTTYNRPYETTPRSRPRLVCRVGDGGNEHPFRADGSYPADGSPANTRGYGNTLVNTSASDLGSVSSNSLSWLASVNAYPPTRPRLNILVRPLAANNMPMMTNWYSAA